MKTDFNQIWSSQAQNDQSRTTRDKVVLSNSFVFYVGRIGVSNAKMLQIEVDQDVAIHKNYLKRFHGVEIRVIESGNSKKDITIILSDNDLLDVFILFLDDLIKELELLSDQHDIPHLINERVSYWGRLFAKVKGELLSKERQRGLYGELLFLLSLLNRSGDHAKCVVCWTGPEGSNQDFSNDLKAVEVKSSKATKPSVNIASELQLDWTVLDSLYLCVTHLDELPNGSDTLYKLITEIKARINSSAELIKLFESKLDSAGVPEGGEELYKETGYVVRSRRTYKVSDGFPALTNSIIDNEAIHNVGYQIDLTACEPFEIDIESVINEMI